MNQDHPSCRAIGCDEVCDLIFPCVIADQRVEASHQLVHFSALRERINQMKHCALIPTGLVPQSWILLLVQARERINPFKNLKQVESVSPLIGPQAKFW